MDKQKAATKSIARHMADMHKELVEEHGLSEQAASVMLGSYFGHMAASLEQGKPPLLDLKPEEPEE